jgi:hypothetical protein
LKLIDLLLQAAAGSPNLVELLRKVAAAAPDFAPEIEAWIARLNATVDPAALAALGHTVLGELADIGTGKLDGRKHPSDVV